MEPVHQRLGAGAQVQHVTLAADLVESGRSSLALPGPAQTDRAPEERWILAVCSVIWVSTGVESGPEAPRASQGSHPPLADEHGGLGDDIPPGLRRRERHAASAGGHDAPSAASAGTGRGTVSHTALAAASTSPPGPSSADPASSLRPSRPPGQAISRHWSPDQRQHRQACRHPGRAGWWCPGPGRRPQRRRSRWDNPALPRPPPAAPSRRRP